MNGGYDVKGIYIENLTGEIMATLDDVIDQDSDDDIFLKAQARVRSIISREYVERKHQKV